MFASYLVDLMYLPLSENSFVRGKRGACLFKEGIPNTNVLALRIDFR